MRPDDLPHLVALRNNPAVNHFMLRTHVDPEAWCREWMAIPDSETDSSCVAQLAAGNHSSAELAELFTVGRATVYRAVNRAEITRAVPAGP